MITMGVKETLPKDLKETLPNDLKDDLKVYFKNTLKFELNQILKDYLKETLPTDLKTTSVDNSKTDGQNETEKLGEIQKISETNREIQVIKVHKNSNYGQKQHPENFIGIDKLRKGDTPLTTGTTSKQSLLLNRQSINSLSAPGGTPSQNMFDPGSAAT
ncbi:MAG: hypothetical protein ACRCU2_29025 [Planktothrix sp.]